MDAQIRGAAVVYGCNGDYTSNGCGWQKSWDPATYKSNCAQCGAMLTTQVRPFAMDSAFDGIYTTEDLHYFQMRGACAVCLASLLCRCCCCSTDSLA
jgi:hypothetical protein